MERNDRLRLMGAAGVALALGGAAYAAWTRNRMRSHGSESTASELELATVEALRSDEHAGGSAIDVAELAPGVIELSGTAADWVAARRAAEVTQSQPGVVTVVNRLEIEALENQLARTRERFMNGDPALHETQWQGMGAGMGGRRQGRDTDPDRRNDSVDLRTEAIERE